MPRSGSRSIVSPCGGAGGRQAFPNWELEKRSSMDAVYVRRSGDSSADCASVLSPERARGGQAFACAGGRDADGHLIP